MNIRFYFTGYHCPNDVEYHSAEFHSIYSIFLYKVSLTIKIVPRCYTDPQSVTPKQASSRKNYLLTGENLQQDQAHGSGGGGGVKMLGKERGRGEINVGFEHRHHTCEGHKYKVEPVREVRKDTDLCLTNRPPQLQRTKNTPFPLPLLREELKTLPKSPVS